jgi:L-rhamnose-H+ transport protein
VMPTLVSIWTVPHLAEVMAGIDPATMVKVYVFGALWGIGGLTFGLSGRYLGMSLGYAVALGFCAAFGTLVPPLVHGQIGTLLNSNSGIAILAGVAVCLGGIALCGYAGVRKERELTESEKKETVAEFALAKGVAVAMFAGVMSACMAFAFDAGQPIIDAAKQAGAEIFVNNPVYIIAMAGGFTTNFIWCLILNLKNKSIADYVTGPAKQTTANYRLACLAGVIWYLQFFFYGMGRTQMGGYDYSSWTIHMAFIIVFSNLWGIYFKEWKGVSKSTMLTVWGGIGVLILSTIVIGLGNFWKA